MGNWKGWENYQPTKNKRLKNKQQVTDQLPKLSEKELTKQIRQYLNLKGIFHWKVWQGLGSIKGVPDILGVLSDGTLLAIEIKTEKGKVSPEQEAFIANLQDKNAIAFIARSVETVRFEIERRIIISVD